MGIAGPADQEAEFRIPALDGIRAVAILLVIIHNAGSVNGALDGVPLKLWAVLSDAGWVGVQLFFALSGFLITRILIAHRGADGWLKSFYTRRALRIFPLYYAVLIFVFLIAPYIALPDAMHQRSGSTVWYWLYLSNWVTPFTPLSSALPHVWSLAVEEQFYLAWPLIVAAVSPKRLGAVCVALVAGALSVRIGLHLGFPEKVASDAAYTWTIARCDAIAMGALVAVLTTRSSSNAPWYRLVGIAFLLSTAALGVVVVAGRGLGAKGLLTEVAGQPLTGLLSALIVLLCVTRPLASSGARTLQRVTRSVLDRSPLRTIGKYSYAIYVFHLPVHLVLHAFVRTRLTYGSGAGRFATHVAYTVVVFVISFALAWVSWRVLEQPFLSLKRHFPMPRPGTARVG